MEQLIIKVYEEEFKRLGPSAVRFVERHLQGYLRFKDSPDPLLRKRAEQYRQGCIKALPLFPAAISNAPTKQMAQKAQAVEQAIIEQVGRGGVKQKIQALLVPALVLAAKLQLRYGTYPQPVSHRSEYRISKHRDLPGECTLRVNLKHQAAVR